MPRSLKILQDHITHVESQYDLLNEEMAKGENAGYGKECISQTSGRMSGMNLFPNCIGPKCCSLHVRWWKNAHQKMNAATFVPETQQIGLGFLLAELEATKRKTQWTQELECFIYSWLFQTCPPMSALLQDMGQFEVLSCHCCRAEGEVLASGPEEIGIILWNASLPLYSRIASTNHMVCAIRKSKQFFDKNDKSDTKDASKKTDADSSKPARKVRKDNRKKKWTCFSNVLAECHAVSSNFNPWRMCWARGLIKML